MPNSNNRPWESSRRQQQNADALAANCTLNSSTKKRRLGNLDISSEKSLLKMLVNGSMSEEQRKNEWKYSGHKTYTREQINEGLKRKSQMVKFQRIYAVTDSIKYCSLHPIPTMGQSPTLSANAKGYGWSGLQSCGNKSCVMCAGRAVGDKVKRIRSAANQAARNEDLVLFVTLTTKRSNDIKTQLSELRKGWKAVQNRLDYDIKKNGGRYGTIRAVDVTFKPQWSTPYHLHLHCIIIVSWGSVAPVYTGRDIMHRIKKAFSKKAWNSRIAAQDVRIVSEDKGVFDYLAKFAGLGFEIANPVGKEGRIQGSYSLYQLIDKAIGEPGSKPHPRYVHIYQEYQRETKGVKMLSFSANWDDWIVEEEEEEEIAAPDLIVSKPWWPAIRGVMHALGRIVFNDKNYGNGEVIADINEVLRSPPNADNIQTLLAIVRCEDE